MWFLPLVAAALASRLWPTLVANERACGEVSPAVIERVQRDLRGFALPAGATGFNVAGSGGCCASVSVQLVDRSNRPLSLFHYGSDCTLVSIPPPLDGQPSWGEPVPIDRAADGSAMRALQTAWPSLAALGPRAIDGAVVEKAGEGWRVSRIDLDTMRWRSFAELDATGAVQRVAARDEPWVPPPAAAASVVAAMVLPDAPTSDEAAR